MPRRGFPRMLLQHTIQVQPYTGWNAWGSSTTVKGLYQEIPYRRHTRAGMVYRVVSTFFAPLETVCPDGSKITLHDARTGYAAYAVQREGGRLPLPIHLEIGIDLGDTRSSAAAETVVLLRRTATGERDKYGNGIFATAEITVAGCTVSILDHHEDDTHGTRVTTTARVVMPPATVVTAVDRMRVRGLVYDVDGPGVVKDDPMLSTPGPVEVSIRRLAG